MGKNNIILLLSSLSRRRANADKTLSEQSIGSATTPQYKVQRAVHALRFRNRHVVNLSRPTHQSHTCTPRRCTMSIVVR